MLNERRDGDRRRVPLAHESHLPVAVEAARDRRCEEENERTSDAGHDDKDLQKQARGSQMQSRSCAECSTRQLTRKSCSTPASAAAATPAVLGSSRSSETVPDDELVADWLADEDGLPKTTRVRVGPCDFECEGDRERVRVADTLADRVLAAALAERLALGGGDSVADELTESLGEDDADVLSLSRLVSVCEKLLPGESAWLAVAA